MATRAANLGEEMDADGRGRTAVDVEQVKRLRPRNDGDESPFCLGVNLSGDRCNRTRREPFCDRHLYQWQALPADTKYAISALADLAENAFNHSLWDSEHLKLRTFLRDVYTRLQAEAVSDSARAWDAAHERAQEEAKDALLAVQETLKGACAALIPCKALTRTASRAEVEDKSSKREDEMAGLRSLLTGTASLHISPSVTGSAARARSRSTSREPRFLARSEDTESLRAEVAALRKAVKSIAALVETSSEENKATMLALCSALAE